VSAEFKTNSKVFSYLETVSRRMSAGESSVLAQEGLQKAYVLNDN